MTDMFVFCIFAHWATISVMRPPPPLARFNHKKIQVTKGVVSNFGCTLSRNEQSRKYLFGRSYKNDKFDWPFDLVIVTS